MPAPSQLVFTHFPDDPDWQLLERPIDLEEFESLVPLKPTFFKYGLHLLSHTNAVIRCPAGRDVSVRIECPKKKVNTVCNFFNCNCMVEINAICYRAVESIHNEIKKSHTVNIQEPTTSLHSSRSRQLFIPQPIIWFLCFSHHSPTNLEFITP